MAFLHDLDLSTFDQSVAGNFSTNGIRGSFALSVNMYICLGNYLFFSTFQKQFTKKIYRDRQFKKLLEHFLPNRVNLNNFLCILHSVKPLNREFQIQNFPFPPKKNGYCLRTLRNQLTLHCVLKFDTPTTF